MMKPIQNKITAITLCLLLASLNGYAQPTDQNSRGRGPGPDQVQHLTETLQLDESQSAQLEIIIAAAREQHESLGRQDREAHCAIKAEVELQLIAILSADQIVSLEELHSERTSQLGKRGGPGPQDCE